MSHSSTCTGCPRCNSVFAALIQAPLREQVQFQQVKSEVENRASMTRLAARGASAPAVLTAGPSVLNAPPVPASRPADGVDDPPSLVSAIRAKAGTAALPAAPIFGGGPVPRHLAASGPADGVDSPPSLIDAIAANHADAVRLRRRK